MDKKQEILKKHWHKKTDLPFDDITKQHLSYVFNAMDEYSEELLERIAEWKNTAREYFDKLELREKELNEIIDLSNLKIAELEKENSDILEFAKYYHNHIMETSKPPFKTRHSINVLLNVFRNRQ